MNERVKKTGLLATRAAMLAFLFVAIGIVAFFWLRDGGVLAWLAESKKTESHGMTVKCDEGSLQLDPLISVVPSYGEEKLRILYYLPDATGTYSEVTTIGADGLEIAGEIDGKPCYFRSDENGNHIPIDLGGLFPGETLTISLSFVNATGKDLVYRLAFEGFDDRDGTFTIDDHEGSTPGTYSVLGLFRARAETENGNAVSDTDRYFATYDTTAGTYTKEDPFLIYRGNISAGERVTFTFSVTVDLSQYRELKGTYANLISKKGFSVGALRLSAEE